MNTWHKIITFPKYREKQNPPNEIDDRIGKMKHIQIRHLVVYWTRDFFFKMS